MIVKKVLVIEDDKITCLLLAKMLHSLNVCCVFARKGAHGLTVLEDNPDISLIFCDYKLPDTDGFSLISEIKGVEDHQETPLILISAFLSVKEISSMMDAGASGFLAKPIKKADLQAELDRYLK